MTLLGHIGYGVEKRVITLITVSGRGLKLVELIENREGPFGDPPPCARNQPSRAAASRKKIQWSERDVLMVLVEAPQADEWFALLFAAAELGEPHQGLIFMELVDRGHHMMPVADER